MVFSGPLATRPFEDSRLQMRLPQMLKDFLPQKRSGAFIYLFIWQESNSAKWSDSKMEFSKHY